jgi:KDO2-lipid IV(A) lauroyltransferase
MNSFLYKFVRGLLFVFSLLPVRAGYFFSSCIYFLLRYVVQYRKKVIYSNIKLVFADLDKAEISKIANRYYRHLSDMFVELWYSLYIPEKEIEKRVRFLNPELISEFYKRGKHVVAVTSHYANWEWCFRFQKCCPHRIMEIYKKMSSPVFDRLFYDIRSRFGGAPVEMSNLRKALAEAKKAPVLFYIVADQSPAGTENSWYFTSFLNVSGTPVYTGAEKIARKLDAAFVYIDMRKTKRGFYEMELTTLCDDAKNTPENYLMDLYLRRTEETILKQPEYWMWSHRRWKRRKITE